MGLGFTVDGFSFGVEGPPFSGFDIWELQVEG